MVGNDVEVIVVSARPGKARLLIKHTALAGRITLEDSFQRDLVSGVSVSLPVTGRVEIVDVNGPQVSLGWKVRKDVSVHRREVWEALRREGIV